MRNVLTVAMSVVLLAACGGAAVPAANHVAAGGIHADVAPAGAALTCRLPVAGFVPPGPKGQVDPSVDVDGQPSQKGAGGFLDLPGGAYRAAADSDRSYLARATAWLPVPPQAVAPDQRSYVAAKISARSSTPPTTTLYLADVKTKTERLIYTAPDGEMAGVLAYTSDGVYVATISATGGGTSQLELIDPATASHRFVPGSWRGAGSAPLYWMAVSGTAAWAMVLTSPPDSQAMLALKLIRLSLLDGSRADWYDVQGSFTIAGFDPQGHPILLVLDHNAGPGGSLAVLTAPKQAVKLGPDGGTLLGGRGFGVTDGHGTWFGSADGTIWLLSSGVLQKVATVPAQAGGSGQPFDPHAWRTIAGPCV